MMQDLGDVSKKFAVRHGIGEIALGGESEYRGQLQVAFEAGAFWAVKHSPDRDEQVKDADMILKGLGFGILTVEDDKVNERRRYAAAEIVDGCFLSDGKGHEMTETALGTPSNPKSNNLSDSTGNTQDTPITQASGHTNHKTKETK